MGADPEYLSRLFVGRLIGIAATTSPKRSMLREVIKQRMVMFADGAAASCAAWSRFRELVASARSQSLAEVRWRLLHE